MLLRKLFGKVSPSSYPEGEEVEEKEEQDEAKLEDVEKEEKICNDATVCNCEFDKLPVEMKWECLKHLPAPDLLTCRLISRHVKNIVDTFSKFEVTLAIEDKLEAAWSKKFLNYISFPWSTNTKINTSTSTNEKKKTNKIEDCEQLTTGSKCKLQSESESKVKVKGSKESSKSKSKKSIVSSDTEAIVEKVGSRIPPFLKANKLIVRRLIRRELNIQKEDLSSLLANVTIMDFLGLISGMNFYRIFQACPRVQKVRFCHESHGGSLIETSSVLKSNPKLVSSKGCSFKRLLWPSKKPKMKTKTTADNEENSVEKLQSPGEEWPDLKQLEFDHSKDIAPIFDMKDFDVSAYCHRGIVSNRILNNIPASNTHKSLEECDTSLPIVILTGSKSKLFCNVQPHELKTLLLVNIFHYNPEKDEISQGNVTLKTGENSQDVEKEIENT